MDSPISIINIKYLQTGLQNTNYNDKQFRNEDISKYISKYIRLEEFYNNTLVNNSQELFPKTLPLPKVRKSHTQLNIHK